MNLAHSALALYHIIVLFALNFGFDITLQKNV